MNALEKLKLTQELKKAIDERNAQTNPLNKLVWVKKVQKLRQELGFVGSGLSDYKRLMEWQKVC